MKIIRSSKCSTKFANTGKMLKLRDVLREYGRVVNVFIDHFWNNGTPSKSSLLKPIVDLPETWITARLRKVAAREAIDMIKSARGRWGDKANVPVHKGLRMSVSSTTSELQFPKKSAGFDAWLHIASIGNGIILDIPIKFHKHFLKLESMGRRMESYIITENYIQFAFEIETGTKRTSGKQIGIDSGINALATTSDGNQYGLDIKHIIDRVKRCKHGSNGQKRARRALKQRIDEIAKEVIRSESPQMIVVEKLKSLNNGTKLKRRLSKNIRRSLGVWTYRYWLEKLKRECEYGRSVYRSVNPAYTSQSCHKCSHTERGNRVKEIFKCLECGYTANADHNAAMNILTRQLTGIYGSGCKQA